MKFIHYTFLLLSCFAIGCFSPSNLSQPAPSPPKLPKPAPSPVKFQFEEGSTVLRKDYYRTLEQTKDGLYVYKVYYPSTSIITLKSTYKDKELKILHGKQIERYDSGEIWTEATYVNGLAQGYCKIGHSTDGSSFSEGMMKDGEKDGKWINTKDAVKVREMYYEDGTLHGKYTTWSETGELLAEAIYEDGAKISEEVYKEDEEIELFRIVDKMPLYGEECHKLEDAKAAKKCGDKALLTQIYRSIKYPSTAVKNNIEGTAIIKFVIEKDGSLTDIEILQGICDEIKAECLRIMNTLDKWQPGEIKGEPVRVQFNLPIRFRLE